jgi:hypothetical protein
MNKIVLTLAIILGTASVALASEADPNLLNRYPGYNMTKSVAAPAFTTRSVALGGGQVTKSGEQLWIDRASAQTGF